VLYRHTFIGSCDFFFTVVSHGVTPSRLIPVSGYGLFYLITIGLSQRGICQQQSNSNRHQYPGHMDCLLSESRQASDHCPGLSHTVNRELSSTMTTIFVEGGAE
jgi:hypothetical protein